MSTRARRRSTSADADVVKVFDDIKHNGDELNSTQKSISIATAQFAPQQPVPEQLKEVLLPGISPMAQDTLRQRLATPNKHVQADFNGMDKWYMQQNASNSMCSTSEWHSANKYMSQRVRERRTQSVNIRENSVQLRSGTDHNLKRKQIEVKNNFVSRKDEIDRKTTKLSALKKQVETELGQLNQAIQALDNFNKVRFLWPAKANEQCLRARSKRLGIDLVADDVDLQLKRQHFSLCPFGRLSFREGTLLIVVHATLSNSLRVKVLAWCMSECQRHNSHCYCDSRPLFRWHGCTGEKDMLETVSEDLDQKFMNAVEHAGMMQECALALGEDIDRKKQAAIAEVKAEKLNLDSQRLELHVHTLREPPRDSVAYNEWKIATEGLEQSAGQLVDESKTMRKEMKFLEERTDAKVRSHENDVFVALRKREQEYNEALDEDKKLLTEVKHEIHTVLTEIDKCVRMIHDQEKPMKRATTRLNKREKGRSSPERTVDNVHSKLMEEAKDIQATVEALQDEIDTHNANLTDLRETEIMLEEDISIKTRSLKIEKKCVYMRSYFAKFKSEKAASTAGAAAKHRA
eukprot:m.883915 g.883915  ORF g.883915 m.883915 type:complete len:575 (-) comp23613_c0_seq2:1714-3438(-)